VAGKGPALLRPVALTGFMGAGKSTVGPLLAERIPAPFHDLDRLIEGAAGTDIPTLFRREGEAGFRLREARALTRMLDERPPAVWALGGGAVTDPGSCAVLRRAGARIVWIRVDWDTVRRRVSAEGRPLLQGGPEAGARLWAEREAVYRRVADFAVDGTGDPARVAETIWARLVELGDVER
jgi:shikimate kinase